MVYTISEIGDMCRPVFEAEPDVERAFVFGSYAKGSARENSDIDILIETKRDIGKRILYLNSILEVLMGKRIDIYMPHELPCLLPKISEDQRLIYAS